MSRFRAMTRNVRASTTALLWVFSIAALGLGIASFMVPPTGQIDPSVLRFVAELFAIMALLELREAVLEGLGVKLTHGNTTIEVHDLDGKPSEHPAPQEPAGDEGAVADDPEAGQTQN
jgi:hypothetical protein